MYLSAIQRNLIERAINTVETGRPVGDYSAIVTYPDGPNDIRQITYGRAQTTDYDIHGGRILWLLRQRFAENPPSQGCSEKAGIREHVHVRHHRLSKPRRPLARKSNSRTKPCKEQIRGLRRAWRDVDEACTGRCPMPPKTHC
jgi:hypothetical protein